MIYRNLAAALLVSIASVTLAQDVGLNESHLNAIDKDRDGTISKAEFDAFSTFAFKQMDDNKDGVLSPDEVDDHVIGDAFNMLDDDGDGVVSSAEFSDQMDNDFVTADKDGDGILN
jgi:Ca2+-binding EF-hand superfamily protein